MCYLSFFFNDTATTEIYTYGHTLSLHDALPISDVGLDPGGEEVDHLHRHLGRHLLRLRLEDRMAQLVCRRMNVGDEAPAQPRPHPLFQPLQIRRGLVGGDDDLPVLVDQRVEGVEELLLRALAPADELHVVDHQDVNRAELLIERHRVAKPNGTDDME